MPPRSDKTLPHKIQPWLTLTASLGLPATAIWAAVASLWQSMTGEALVSKQLLLVSTGVAASCFLLLLWVLVKQHQHLTSLKKPRHFLDDYQFLPEIGLYLHLDSNSLCCGYCACENLRVPVMERECGWLCPNSSDHQFSKPSS